MSGPKSFFKGDWLGVHFAVNIFIATTIVWLLMRLWTNASPIWAISSMIATSDPLVKQAIKTFRGRVINALIGCATGMTVLLIGGSSEWKLPLALSASILVSSYLVRVQVMFRQAPITAAIVVAGGLAHHSKLSGAQEGLKRVAEVMIGCVVGLMVTWLMSMIWPPPEVAKEGASPPGRAGQT